MTRTEELLAEATAWYKAHQLDVVPIQYVDLQQLVELVRLQHQVITCISGTTAPILTQQMRQQAIEAFNKWEGE